jgi:hypothetical protein
MSHPNAFPDTSNPREVRAYMHTVYGRYVHGQDMFPKIRMLSSPDEMSRKCRGIAQNLVEAWGVIDEDNAYFTDMTVRAVEHFKTLPEAGSGIVYSKVGRNAINFAILSTPGNSEQIKIAHGVQDTKSFVEQTNGKAYTLTDGRVVRVAEGHVQSDDIADAVILRKSGLASMYVAHRSPESETALSI